MERKYLCRLLTSKQLAKTAYIYIVRTEKPLHKINYKIKGSLMHRKRKTHVKSTGIRAFSIVLRSVLFPINFKVYFFQIEPMLRVRAVFP